MSYRGPEGKIQDSITKKLKTIKDSFWVKSTVTNKAGTQDILGDIKGTAVYIEVKYEGKKPEKLQDYRINKAVERGAISFYTTGWEDCKTKLSKFCENKKIELRFLI